MDPTALIGVLVAFGLILTGQALEGGHIGSLLQGSAALIVVGGTAGATIVSFPARDLFRGFRAGGVAFKSAKNDSAELIKSLVELASMARRDGVLALERRMAELRDVFMKRAVGLLVDGVDAAVARESLETNIQKEFEEGSIGVKVFEAAGGYSPTIGIIGAVLGLIHVMENLSDPSKLGGGIATAFVATIYGLVLANIFLLPISSKLKRRLILDRERRTLIMEGVLGIQAGLNPHILEERLQSYAGQQDKAKETQ